MGRLIVVDTETTGVGETDQVVEIAIDGWSTLVRPTCPISHGARAAHHITDEELSSAPTMAELLATRGLPEFTGDDAVFVAHNAEFDWRMLRQSGVPEAIMPRRKICTWRAALHLFPDAPGYSNQVLRYYLGVEVPPQSHPPHRASPDVAVTRAILGRMLLEATEEKLIELTTAPVLLTTIHFGKHRGRRWQDVETDYLKWLLTKDFGPDEVHTAKYWIGERNKKRAALP